jgi:hypothetical protein
MNWLHRLLNPHCEHCLKELELNQHCKTCDVLQYEVERLRAENERLLSRVLHIPEREPERLVAPEPQALRPGAMTWAVRRQMLEAEDREKAKLINKAPQPDDTINKLEEELLNASTAREKESSKR